MRTMKTDSIGGVLALVAGLAAAAWAQHAAASTTTCQQLGQLVAGDGQSLQSTLASRHASTVSGGETEEDYWRRWYYRHYHYYPAVRYYYYYPRVAYWRVPIVIVDGQEKDSATAGQTDTVSARGQRGGHNLMWVSTEREE